jgi:hypothetical protein
MLLISSMMIDGLADAGAAEQADLAALRVRLEQIDDLDAGLEHLQLGRLLFERRRRTVNRPVSPWAATGRSGKSTGSPSSSARGRASPAHGTVMAAPVSMTVMPRVMPSVGFMPRPAPVLAEVLLDFGDHVDLLAAVGAVRHDAEPRCRARGGPRELDVDDRADHLHDLARPLRCCCSARHAASFCPYVAAAPDTTSMISRVIAACRTLFM